MFCRSNIETLLPDGDVIFGVTNRKIRGPFMTGTFTESEIVAAGIFPDMSMAEPLKIDRYDIWSPHQNSCHRFSV